MVEGLTGLNFRMSFYLIKVDLGVSFLYFYSFLCVYSKVLSASLL